MIRDARPLLMTRCRLKPRQHEWLCISCQKLTLLLPA